MFLYYFLIRSLLKYKFAWNWEVRSLKVRSLKSGVRKSVVRSPKTKFRSLKSGVRSPKSGVRKSGAGLFFGKLVFVADEGAQEFHLFAQVVYHFAVIGTIAAALPVTTLLFRL